MAESVVKIQVTTRGLPPIKLDGKVYFLQTGTYSVKYSEKLIEEAYAADTDMDRQMRNTDKHRWSFTILVPINTNLLDINGDLSPSDCGTRTDLHTSADKEPPSDLLDFYDISTNWDFSGAKTHQVYLTLGDEAPHNDDIGKWTIVVTLWGKDA